MALKVYGYCEAGCRREVVYKADFLEQLAKMGIVVATDSGETVMMRFVTQAEYNAIVAADELLADCLYIIEDDATLASMSNRITTAQSTANTARATANTANSTANANKEKIDSAFPTPAVPESRVITSSDYGFYHIAFKHGAGTGVVLDFGVVYIGGLTAFGDCIYTPTMFDETTGYRIKVVRQSGNYCTVNAEHYGEKGTPGVYSDISGQCEFYISKVWGGLNVVS